jgi:hypothetical protein
VRLPGQDAVGSSTWVRFGTGRTLAVAQYLLPSPVMVRVLCCWIGNTDLRASAGDASPAPELQEQFAKVVWKACDQRELQGEVASVGRGLSESLTQRAFSGRL